MTRPVLRFAPSPNGRLHLGHARSALLNDALARSSGGRLLLRIEDLDPGRSRPEWIAAIAEDLAWLGLRFEAPVRRQSAHLANYHAEIRNLAARGLAYPCFCSRGDIAAAVEAQASRGGQPVPRDPDGAPLYPGTCRHLPPAEAEARRAAGRPHTWRLHMARALEAAPGPHAVRSFSVEMGEGEIGEGRGPGTHRIGAERFEPADPGRWGDPVIARRDVPTSYHLAVVMDDALQGITHVVRGADLRASTDLHVLLQALIGAASPRYHHHALVLDETGEKLAKSRGSRSLADLRAAGADAAALRRRLGFP
ncbi:tRNA glutamyl-Q(34) synthetase GluQRS [Methylobacterium sp. J-068]|uniref:tRNA glutamyl-Q(34) synthetase GluQRS n=1 Tax=Methylobacterium sp. J-068 TaxID=2836649 RepID=UPI001FBB07D0|nr:tRNA glutamyl-Q(34) synthetase GluQRS [Methylobacterium sp. J-068]MCJ2032650.1 tRNA glutamyl-Q(34) synthetase GluQRS [Methylobacterium sp. J-068]